MLKELKFVQGAVSRKDFLPAMTHFVIEAGTVRAYNGIIALCSPLPFDIDCKPKAADLVQAISKCTETVTLAMTPAGRLSIKSGAFKAFIECVQEDTLHVLPEGERVDFDGAAMLEAFKVLVEFIGDDASRPWCNGVLLRGQSAYATNNVVLVEYWTGAPMPIVVNIPSAAIREMLRIDEPPTHAQVTPTSMTFHYSDGRWVRTQLLGIEWPGLDPILNSPHPNILPIDADIFVGLEMLKPFVDKYGRVYINNSVMSTTPEAAEGAHYELEDPSFALEGIYNIEMLLLLKGVATDVDFTTYPRPCMFFGNRLRGAIIGMRQA